MLGLVGVMLAAGPARAEEGGADAVGEAIAGTLPSSWRVDAHAGGEGVVEATLVVPGGWRGSPVSAGLNACPGPESGVWRSVRLVRITVLVNGRRSPAIDCRQG